MMALMSIVAGPVFAASLYDEVPVLNVSGSQGSKQYFEIVVPSGQASLTISMAAGSGDADMYVRYGSPPDLGAWQYRPYLDGNAESVRIGNPAGGRWYVMVHGYRAFSGLMIIADYASSTFGMTTLTNDASIRNVAGAQGSNRYYTFYVPSGQSSLSFGIGGGVGDSDIYVRRGGWPTSTNYDYRPFLDGNDESVWISNPLAGTYYVVLNGYTAYAGVTLSASYGGSSATGISNGVGISGLGGAQGTWRQFRVDVPAGVEALMVTLRNVSGDADLYVKRGSEPSTGSFEYRPYLANGNETVTVTRPAAGAWYMGIHAYAAYTGAEIRATFGNFATVLNDYPFGNQAFPCDSVIDLWGFYKGQCTSYVAWRMNRDMGAVNSPWWFTNSITGAGTPGPNCTNVPGARLSNACYWAARLEDALGATVNTTPAVGSIAHWSGQGTGALRYGHIGYVECVNADGTVLVSEYNFANPCGFGIRDNVWADRYIHLR